MTHDLSSIFSRKRKMQCLFDLLMLLSKKKKMEHKRNEVWLRHMCCYMELGAPKALAATTSHSQLLTTHTHTFEHYKHLCHTLQAHIGHLRTHFVSSSKSSLPKISILHFVLPLLSSKLKRKLECGYFGDNIFNFPQCFCCCCCYSVLFSFILCFWEKM